jgi:hypothetical protein
MLDTRQEKKFSASDAKELFDRIDKEHDFLEYS